MMMKKMTLTLVVLVALTMSSCGTMMSSQNGGTQSTTSGASTGTTDAVSVLGGILGNVLGLNTITEQNLYGTWKYSAPGCAFTSDNMLAKAGGEVAAQRVKTQLKEYYDKVGIKSSNTQFTFNEDKTFTAKIDGKSFSGTYTFDSSENKLTLQSLLINMPCYVQRSGSSLGLLVESQKLLQVLQTIARLSNNSSLQAIGTISENFDGVRLGFEMTK